MDILDEIGKHIPEEQIEEAITEMAEERFANFIEDSNGKMVHTQWETTPIPHRKSKIPAGKKKAKRKMAKTSRKKNRRR